MLRLLALTAIFAFVQAVTAQSPVSQVSLSATVTDPNGKPYAFGEYQVVMADTLGQQLSPSAPLTINGVNFQPMTFAGTLDANGAFSVQVISTSVISPSTQYKATVCSPKAGQFILSSQRSCFSFAGIVTGATNWSSQLSALATPAFWLNSSTGASSFPGTGSGVGTSGPNVTLQFVGGAATSPGANKLMIEPALPITTPWIESPAPNPAPFNTDFPNIGAIPLYITTPNAPFVSQESWMTQDQFSNNNGGNTNTVAVPSGVTIFGQQIIKFGTGQSGNYPNILPYNGGPIGGITAPGNVTGSATVLKTTEVFRTGNAVLQMDGPAAINDLVVPSTTNLGFGHDSGSTLISDIPCTTPVVGEVQTSSGTGINTVARVRVYNVGSFGTNCAGSGGGGSGDVSNQKAGFIPLASLNATDGTTIDAISHIDEGATLPDTDSVSNPFYVDPPDQPAQIDLVPTTVAPLVVAGSASLAAPATVTTAGVYLLPKAPGTGVIVGINTDSIVQTSFVSGFTGNVTLSGCTLTYSNGILQAKAGTC